MGNAYDAAIVANTPAGLPHWTTDPYRLFPVRWRAARDGTRIDANRSPREQIERAVRAAGPGAPPGKVIAELTFGFWRYLPITAHHHPLWIPYLHNAFAAGTSRPAVDWPVGRLHQLRNRIAHYEPLLRRNRATGMLSLTTQQLVHHHGDLLTVADIISPNLRDYIPAASTVGDQIDKIRRCGPCSGPRWGSPRLRGRAGQAIWPRLSSTSQLRCSTTGTAGSDSAGARPAAARTAACSSKAPGRIRRCASSRACR